MSVTSLISCRCGIKHETIVDGEIVCRQCGCVKGFQQVADILAHSKLSIKNNDSSVSKRSLYSELQLGGKNKSKGYLRMSTLKSSELSAVSNICNSLLLPSYLSHDVWFWYNKIRTNIKITKAKIIILVFYQLCRYNEIPLDEKQLNKIIQMNLHTKSSYSSLKIICEANSFLDENGIPILEKIGFNNLTVHNMQFLLRSKLKSLRSKYSPEIMIEIERHCKEFFPIVSGTSEEIAKITVKLALEKCKLC